MTSQLMTGPPDSRPAASVITGPTSAEGGGQPHPVSWSMSAHARRLLTLALTGLVIAMVTGRVAFAGLAAPAILLLATWRPRRAASITVAVQVSARQIVEGEQASVIATVTGHGEDTVQVAIAATEAFSAGPASERLATTGPARRHQDSSGQDSGDQDSAYPASDGAAATDPARAATRARPTSLRVPFRAERWGIRRIGRLEIVLRDRFRLTEGHVTVNLPRIDCHPRPAELRGKVVLSRLPSRLGEHPSRAIGEGIEFAGVRQFVPGDRQRRINWPATTRTGTLQLNTFTAERTQNVVVIADASSNVGEPGGTSLDLAFRAAAGTITCYLASGDRVGLIVYADRLSWIGPGLGRRHFHRLMELLLSSHRGWERASGLARLPKAALPPGALIMVFSPLLHPRLVEALRDLRERGFSVLVVDVLTAAPAASRDRSAAIARRIWRLEQQAIRFSLTELGIPVVHWDGQQSLDEPLAPYTRRVLLAGRT